MLFLELRIFLKQRGDLLLRVFFKTAQLQNELSLASLIFFQKQLRIRLQLS